MGKTKRLKMNKRKHSEYMKARAREMVIKSRKRKEAESSSVESTGLTLLNLDELAQFTNSTQNSTGLIEQSTSESSVANTNDGSSEQKRMESPIVHEELEELTYAVEFEDVEFDSSDAVSGHRVVDMKHFYEELVKISNHESLFQCGLSAMELTSEKTSGLVSEFTFTCSLCKKQFKIQNSTEKLNKMAVAGMMAAGCGSVELKQFSAALDLPSMSDYKFKIVQDEVCDEWEVTAWEEMKKAGEREKEAAIKDGRVTKDGIPIIDVILDGCWSKRSYKTNYSALSGAATIIGRRFRQVLFMGVKNKYCCICARAEKRKDTVVPHECFKNYTGSSTAMESTIIAEGFKQSVAMHGVIYGRFIADGDSSTYAKILETRPYPSITVEKIGCKNHILRNFCNKLQSLKTDTKFCIAERKTLNTKKILKARKYICDSIEYHGSTSCDQSEKIKNLHRDITNAIHHGFDHHNSCNREICSENSTEESKDTIINTRLWNQMRHLISNISSKSRSLIENVHSNIVESFNGVIAKFVGGKRVNYALKRSYQARCSGAVVSFNSGKILTTVHKTIHQTSPLAKIKQYEGKTKNRRTYNNTFKKKKNRTLFCKKIDFDYGENADQPDLDPNSFELAKEAFLKNLEKTEEERKAIEQRTVLQSESGEWLELRRNLLTASNFGKVVKRKKTNSCASMVRNMIYKPNIDHVSSISHGKKNEKAALEQLACLKKLQIKECGLFIDEKYPFLGATPDGITDENMIIEVKCPIAPYKMGIDAAIREGKMHFWRYDKKAETVIVNTKSDWYMQAQGQMHICKAEKCLLAVWYGENKIKTEIILKDDNYWQTNMEPHLLSFYNDCLLPELVDPRHTRKRPIREPEYVVLKKKKPMTKNKENENREIEETKKTEIEKKQEGESLELRLPQDDSTEQIGFEQYLDFSSF